MSLRQSALCGSGLILLIAAVSLRADVIGPGRVFGDEPPRERIRAANDDEVHPSRVLPVNVDGRWGHVAYSRWRQGVEGPWESVHFTPRMLVVPQFEWTDYFYTTFLRLVTDTPLPRDPSDPDPFQIAYVPPPAEYLGTFFYTYPTRNVPGVVTVQAQALARAMLNGKTGYINLEGNWSIGPRYDYADRFSEGYAVVALRATDDARRLSYGMLNVIGKPIVPLEWDAMLRMRDGMAAVQRGDRCGFIDKAGKLAIELEFDQVRSFSDSIAVARRVDREGKPVEYGYIDKRGKYQWVDSARRYDELFDFQDGMARVRSGRKWGFINRRYDLVVPLELDEARDFSDGLAAVRIGNQWGFIDKRPKGVIKPGFDAVSDFEAPQTYTCEDHPLGKDPRGSTWAVVVQDGRYGYTDRLLRFGVAPQFDDALPFFRGFGRVAFGPNFGYITHRGEVAWDPRQVLAYGFEEPRHEHDNRNTIYDDERFYDPRIYRQQLQHTGDPPRLWLGVSRVEGFTRHPAAPYPDDESYDHVLPNRQLP